jgi:hypothetical protein
MMLTRRSITSVAPTNEILAADRHAPPFQAGGVVVLGNPTVPLPSLDNQKIDPYKCMNCTLIKISSYMVLGMYRRMAIVNNCGICWQ